MRRSISRQRSGALHPPPSSTNLLPPPSAITTTQKLAAPAPPSNKKQSLHRKRNGKLHLLLCIISIMLLICVCLTRMYSAVASTNTTDIESGYEKNFGHATNNNDENNVEIGNHGDFFTSNGIESLEKVANSIFKMAAKFTETKEASHNEMVEMTKNVHDLNQFIRQNLSVIKEKLQNENTLDTRTEIRSVNNEETSTLAISKNEQDEKMNKKRIQATVRAQSQRITKLGARTAIFFNTFQHHKDTERANEIIEDQLQKINAQKLLHNSTIYYSRFGDHTTIPFPVSMCENDNQRRCIQFAAQDEGDEKHTLQYLYDYCSANHNDTAIYIHTKGAYTPSKENTLLRDILMEAVLSEECLAIDINSCSTSTNHDNKSRSCCNTCSTQFHGVPSHYPGNMWVAQCDYVSKLIPPKKFESKKQNVLQQVKEGTKAIEDSNFFETSLSDGVTFKFHKSKLWMLDSESMLGINRFAMEQWIGSHPDLSPCEVFSPKDGVPIFRYGTIEEKGLNAATLTPVRQFAPGVQFQEFWEDKSFKLHPMFRKTGRIFDYKVLYSKEPDESSWFHSFWHKS